MQNNMHNSMQTKRKAKTHEDLEIFQNAFNAAMVIYELSKKFPVEERYSLTDQIRRSSRSVCANLAEAWRKRRYKPFIEIHQFRIFRGDGATGRRGEINLRLFDSLSIYSRSIYDLKISQSPSFPVSPKDTIFHPDLC